MIMKFLCESWSNIDSLATLHEEAPPEKTQRLIFGDQAYLSTFEGRPLL
jgi:hypothetical protein